MDGSRVVRIALALEPPTVVEITSNVLRHAKASAMSVETVLRDDTLVTTITDDGIGFDGADTDAGNGLRNLRRRAQEIGGNITLARRDRGTRIELTMPLQPSQATQPAPESRAPS